MRIETPAKARELHARLVRRGLERHHYQVSQVLISYSSSHNLLYKARLLFDQLLPRTFNSNLMIRAYSESDHHHRNEPIYIYNQMRQHSLILNDSTFVSLVKACTRFHHTLHGQEAHLTCIKLGFSSYLYVSNAFIHMYVSFRDLRSAHTMFDEMPHRDLFSWKSMVCGYSGVNLFVEVLNVFKAMQVEGLVKGDSDTMANVVLACKHLNDKKFAHDVVKYIEENNVEINVYLGNTLIDFYGRHGYMGSARNVFDNMPGRNLVSWNSMIMLYAKVGNLMEARGFFNRMPIKDVISWTTMITGYSRAKKYSDALYLFEDMMTAKVKPDVKTISIVLSCCGHLRKLDYGVDVHKYICSYNIRANVILGNALISMYFNCRSTQKAMKVFQEMKQKNVVSWTAVVVGFALNGYAKEALKFYSDMLREGLFPTDATFTGVLVACAHAGLVDEGLNYFESMRNVHHIEPTKQHYGCVVNLLSKSGLLDKAYDFIQSIPGHQDAVVWRTLLSGCKVHGNVVLAEIAFKKLLEMDPSNRTNYLVLFNTSAGAG